MTIKGLQATSDAGPGPACRILTASLTAYFAQCNTTEIKLYRVNAGSYHTGTGAGNFASYSGDAAGAAVNDVIRLEVSGTGATVTIVVKKNGTSVITATDTDASRLTATGNWGMWVGGGSTSNVLIVDDWSGNLLAGGDLSRAVSDSNLKLSESVTPSLVGGSDLSVASIGEPVIGGSTF